MTRKSHLAYIYLPPELPNNKYEVRENRNSFCLTISVVGFSTKFLFALTSYTEKEQLLVATPINLL